MLPDLSVSGLLGWGLLAVPPFVLLAVIVITQTMALRAQRGALDPELSEAQSRDVRPTSGAVALAGAGAPATAGREPAVARLMEPGPVGGSGRAGAVRGPPERSGAPCQSQVLAVRALIVEAEKAGDRTALAELCLKQAGVLRGAGDVREAGDLIRKAIIIAMETKNAILHARARLDLGEIAEEMGDLTTACEHWQMARSLFTDSGQEDRGEDVAQRMVSRGCPTEWVLTDF